MTSSTPKIALLLTSLLSLGAAQLASESSAGNSAQKFINTVENEWYRHKAGNIEEWYPFGHTNPAHAAALKLLGPTPSVSKDWSITNKAYLAEDDWYAVEWFYSATNLAPGRKQVECTLGFSQIKNQKIVQWIEYFDDTVGEQQMNGTLSLYTETDEPFPWPAVNPPRRVYRP